MKTQGWIPHRVSSPFACPPVARQEPQGSKCLTPPLAASLVSLIREGHGQERGTHSPSSPRLDGQRKYITWQSKQASVTVQPWVGRWSKWKASFHRPTAPRMQARCPGSLTRLFRSHERHFQRLGVRSAMQRGGLPNQSEVPLSHVWCHQTQAGDAGKPYRSSTFAAPSRLTTTSRPR